MKATSADLFERAHVRPKAGRALVVGSQVYGARPDRRLRYGEAIGADMLPGPGVDWVLNLEEPLPPGLGLFDHVDCLSVLEHSKRPWLLAANLQRMMKPGATIFVTVPFVWKVHAYPDDYFRFTPAGLALVLPAIRWEALRLVHWAIEPEGAVRLPSEKMRNDENGPPWFPRTETMGFGVKA